MSHPDGFLHATGVRHIYLIIFNNCKIIVFELTRARQDVEGGAHAEDALGRTEVSVARLHEAGEDGEEVVEEVHVDGVAVRRYAPGRRGCDY